MRRPLVVLLLLMVEALFVPKRGREMPSCDKNLRRKSGGMHETPELPGTGGLPLRKLRTLS